MRQGVVSGWRCARCGGALFYDDGEYRCLACGTEYTERDGVLAVMQAEPGTVWHLHGKHKLRKEAD